MSEISHIVPDPVTLLQDLIRFDTTNPPGNEASCINYIKEMLEQRGFSPQLYAKEPTRPNLYCRYEGRGEELPLLLYGHVDVVTTAGQEWKHDPFGGEVIDEYVWGRGALDMKGGVAMLVHAFMRLKAEGVRPAGDIILLLLSDEEAGGDFGAKFMVDEHAELFDGVRYAMGEFGGFNFGFGGKRFYLIQVAEKQACWMSLTVRGPGGHASGIVPDNAMERMSIILKQLTSKRLPVHITSPVRTMFNSIAEQLPFFTRIAVKQLLNPRLNDVLLKRLGNIGLTFVPMFHNTANPTIVRGGEKVNVIPSEITVQVDGRLLPGFTPEDMFAEIKQLIGETPAEIDVVMYDPGPADIDMGLFDLLGSVLKEMDPQGIPVPFLLTAVTDARFFSRLGIQSYGFVPMKLPADFEFWKLAHAADERVPVEAIEFGAEAIFRALKLYNGLGD